MLEAAVGFLKAQNVGRFFDYLEALQFIFTRSWTGGSRAQQATSVPCADP